MCTRILGSSDLRARTLAASPRPGELELYVSIQRACVKTLPAPTCSACASIHFKASSAAHQLGSRNSRAHGLPRPWLGAVRALEREHVGLHQGPEERTGLWTLHARRQQACSAARQEVLRPAEPSERAPHGRAAQRLSSRTRRRNFLAPSAQK